MLCVTILGGLLPFYGPLGTCSVEKCLIIILAGGACHRVLAEAFCTHVQHLMGPELEVAPS